MEVSLNHNSANQNKINSLEIGDKNFCFDRLPTELILDIFANHNLKVEEVSGFYRSIYSISHKFYKLASKFIVDFINNKTYMCHCGFKTFSHLENFAKINGLFLRCLDVWDIPLSNSEICKLVKLYPNLEHFYTNCEVNEDGMASISKLHKLKTLSLESSALKSLSGMRFLTNLEELILKNSLAIADISDLTYMENLKILAISENSKINMSDFYTMKCLEKRFELNVYTTDLSTIQTECIEKMLKLKKNKENLHIYICDQDENYLDIEDFLA